MTATTSKRETWRDWQPPGAPEPEVMTRDELVSRLNAVGVSVTEKDIQFWEYQQVLPRPTKKRRDNITRAYYPQWMITTIAVLRSLQAIGMSLRDIAPKLKRTPASALKLLSRTDDLHAPLEGESPQARELASGQATDELLKKLAIGIARDELFETLGPDIARLAMRFEIVTGNRPARIAISFADAADEELDTFVTRIHTSTTS